jgi:hypothetical protein
LFSRHASSYRFQINNQQSTLTNLQSLPFHIYLNLRPCLWILLQQIIRQRLTHVLLNDASQWPRAPFGMIVLRQQPSLGWFGEFQRQAALVWPAVYSPQAATATKANASTRCFMSA